MGWVSLWVVPFLLGASLGPAEGWRTGSKTSTVENATERLHFRVNTASCSSLSSLPLSLSL
ncbi:hypothetical protein COCON_G00084780 [Conger conger]|uniref:Uncharacterized protein n=1 Tax=Conger conger TaxID=82655 RepID=A0A9Q1I2A1_CONCO|nr:hypothetical protein COCON_G00084780 [Conger conger]